MQGPWANAGNGTITGLLKEFLELGDNLKKQAKEKAKKAKEDYRNTIDGFTKSVSQREAKTNTCGIGGSLFFTRPPRTEPPLSHGAVRPRGNALQMNIAATQGSFGTPVSKYLNKATL